VLDKLIQIDRRLISHAASRDRGPRHPQTTNPHYAAVGEMAAGDTILTGTPDWDVSMPFPDQLPPDDLLPLPAWCVLAIIVVVLLLVM
jgi:hypothetical protein